MATISDGKTFGPEWAAHFRKTNWNFRSVSEQKEDTTKSLIVGPAASFIPPSQSNYQGLGELTAGPFLSGIWRSGTRSEQYGMKLAQRNRKKSWKKTRYPDAKPLLLEKKKGVDKDHAGRATKSFHDLLATLADRRGADNLERFLVTTLFTREGTLSEGSFRDEALIFKALRLRDPDLVPQVAFEEAHKGLLQLGDVVVSDEYSFAPALEYAETYALLVISWQMQEEEKHCEAEGLRNLLVRAGGNTYQRAFAKTAYVQLMIKTFENNERSTRRELKKLARIPLTVRKYDYVTCYAAVGILEKLRTTSGFFQSIIEEMYRNNFKLWRLTLSEKANRGVNETIKRQNRKRMEAILDQVASMMRSPSPGKVNTQQVSEMVSSYFGLCEKMVPNIYLTIGEITKYRLQDATKMTRMIERGSALQREFAMRVMSKDPFWFAWLLEKAGERRARVLIKALCSIADVIPVDNCSRYISEHLRESTIEKDRLHRLFDDAYPKLFERFASYKGWVEQERSDLERTLSSGSLSLRSRTSVEKALRLFETIDPEPTGDDDGKGNGESSGSSAPSQGPSGFTPTVIPGGSQAMGATSFVSSLYQASTYATIAPPPQTLRG